MITKWLLVFVLEHKHNFHFIIIIDLQFCKKTHLNRHRILSVSGIRGRHLNALIKCFEMSPNLTPSLIDPFSGQPLDQV